MNPVVTDAFRHLSDPALTLEWRRKCKELGVCCVCQTSVGSRTCEGECAKTYKRWCATASRLEKAAKMAAKGLDRHGHPMGVSGTGLEYPPPPPLLGARHDLAAREHSVLAREEACVRAENEISNRE
ncbi:hypothetical protein KIPB_014738, partial [Kipferlia bialata]|eukprot:g14738.t1